MKIYALNGFQYPIEPRMAPLISPHRAVYPYHGNWTARRAESLSAQIREPAILFGFSDGAEAAARVAAINPNVRALIVHSIASIGTKIPQAVKFWAFRTTGDKTPTFEGTKRFFDRQSHGQLATLLPSPFAGPKTIIERRFLEPLNHQFHNAMPMLVAILNKEIGNGP